MCDESAASFSELGGCVQVMDIDSYKFQYQKASFKLTPGFHTLEWVYHKDVAYEMGEDTAWVRSITVRTTPCSLHAHTNNQPSSSALEPQSVRNISLARSRGPVGCRWSSPCECAPFAAASHSS